MAADTLTPKQLHVFAYICRQADLGETVTFRKLAAKFGWNGCSSAAYFFLSTLRRKGLVAYEPKRKATIRPTARITLFREYL